MPLKKFLSSVMAMFFFLTAQVYSATPADIYKQMGGIAALAEACFSSEKIPTLLNVKIAETLEQNPDLGEMMDTLIEEYNEGYYTSGAKQIIWNASEQSYNKTPFDCEDTEDVKTIKQLEQTVLDNLK